MDTEEENKSNDSLHDAESPREIPGRGWKQIALRVKNQVEKNNAIIVAAGVAFFFFLSIFPILAALVSVYGLIVEPGQVQDQIVKFTYVLPDQPHQLLSDVLTQLAQEDNEALGWSVFIGFFISIISASRGTMALFKGINFAYHEEEDRNFLRVFGLALLFTVSLIVVGLICSGLVVGFPAFSEYLGLPESIKTIISWLRWPVLAAIVIVSLALTYRFAPNRTDAKFKWVSWGASIATGLWLLGSSAFSLFVNNFGGFNKTSETLAAVIILMLWFFLSAFIILLGAEINSEMEHQTRKDSTIGDPKPMGERGAYHADHVATESEE